jgi:hypothetical protein
MKNSSLWTGSRRAVARVESAAHCVSVYAFMVHLLALLLLLPASDVSAQSQSGRVEVVDKMVATVNRQLITYSDLLWQLALQPGTPIDEPRSEDLNGALQLLINQRLFHGEADRLPHIEPKDDEVEAALAALIRRFPSQSEFYKRIEHVGLTAEQLRETVRERVEIERYLDFRFRSFTIVSEKEIGDYYRDAYVPRFRQLSPGRIVPKLEEVRAEIERTLTEGKIESDISALLEDMRTRAEIVILSPL